MKQLTFLLVSLAVIWQGCQPKTNEAQTAPAVASADVFASPDISEEKLAVSMSYATENEARFSPCYDDPADQIGSIFKGFEDLMVDATAAMTGTELTPAVEMEIGEVFHQQIQKEFVLLERDSRKQKLEAMLRKMLAFRTRKEINYKIYLIRDSELINAFATIGGNIYFTTGLLDFVGSDSELAFILGHEIAHVDDKHCTRSVQKEVTIRELGGEYGEMVSAVNRTLSTPFGQFDEYQADRIGAKFANEAGYDPYKGLDFFRKLKQQEKYNHLEKLLRTHPYSEQREQCLKFFIENEL